MNGAEELKALIFARLGLKDDELVCPREKSDMTPCVCRDGRLAETGDGHCVGCGASVKELLVQEREKHRAVGNKEQNGHIAQQPQQSSAAALSE